MKITNKETHTINSIDDLITQYIKEYEDVYTTQIDDELFIYRMLNRKEFRNIFMSQLDDMSKQDMICRATVLYPENYDFENCPAGIPSILYEEILKKSFLDSAQTMLDLIDIGREETREIQSEMSCIIAEAFPSYTYDEIEEWNMYKFCRLYTKAEWILENLKGVTFNKDIKEFLQEIAEQELSYNGNIDIKQSPKEEFNNEILEEEVIEKNQTSNTDIGKMTPEQMKAYQEFIKKFPEIEMEHDAIFTGGETINASTVPPALREGWYRKH